MMKGTAPSIALALALLCSSRAHAEAEASDPPVRVDLSGCSDMDISSVRAFLSLELQGPLLWDEPAASGQVVLVQQVTLESGNVINISEEGSI